MTNQPAPVATDDQDDDYTTVRRVLTEDEHHTAYDQAQAATRAVNITVPYPVLTDVVRGVLAAAGLLTPPPEPDTHDGTCTALFPDDEGVWWQCELDPHDSTDRHDAGDWAWRDGAPNAVPAQQNEPATDSPQ